MKLVRRFSFLLLLLYFDICSTTTTTDFRWVSYNGMSKQKRRENNGREVSQLELFVLQMSRETLV